MFKEFNVEFQDVEMIGGADNLLENTKVTKVVMSGDNKMSSLNSAFKNCSELDNIQGGLDLNGVNDIDNILEGNSLIKSIDLKNINNENISANNSFPNVEEINICGDSYNKKAIQNVIASKEWTFDNITYSDVVGDNVTTKEVNVVDDNKLVIKDTLEQKAKGIEIVGQTYENLAKGKGEYDLTDTYSATWTESNNSFEDMPNMIEISEIWGNTVQDKSDLNIIQSVGDLYVDESGEPILDEEGNEQYKLEIESTNNINLIDPNNWTKLGTDYYQIIKLEANRDYIYYGNQSNNNLVWHSLRYCDSEGNETTHIFSKRCSISDTFKFTTGDSNIYVKAYWNASNLSIINNQYLPMLVKGSTVLPYIEGTGNNQSNKTTILLPQQLKGLSGIKDRLFYDYTKNMYVIENKIGDFNNINDLSEAILDVPQIIETKILEKLSLETYSPTTYISTNTEIQPSQMIITSKKTMLTPSQLQANKEYTLQFECKEKGDNSIKFSLGGAEKEIDATLGVNHINITTLNELSNNDLVLSGQGNKISDVMLIEGDMKQYPNYFDGTKSVGVLQDDNTYKINIKTNEDFIISIKTNLPLTKDDKLYWNDINKRYEIDRNGVIEVPTVEGDVIDLPRLYQREDTVLTVGTDNIKPSEIKIEYKDLN